MKRALLMAAVFWTAGILPSMAQEGAPEVEIKATPVAGSVYMLQGQGGNIGVSVGEDGVLMIDDQFAPLSDKIHAAVDQLGDEPIKFLLNTHWHGDHTGGNENFGAEATIIAHDNVRKRLSTEQFIALFNMKSEPRPKVGLPVITFQDSVTIYFNDEEVDVLHLPHGHTDGDSVIFFKGSNVVHMGDHFFNGMYPFVDLDSGGDVEGYKNNVAAVIAMLPEDVKIIPGHGPAGTLDDLKAFHEMLVETTDIVHNAVRKGKTLRQIKSRSLPPAIVRKWGDGVLNTDQWLEIMYKSYGGK